jgi:hypothetical protein
MDLTNEVGLERIQRSAAILMLNRLNDAIDVQQTLWSARDAAYFAAFGVTDPGYTIDHILPANIHSGTIPSLLQSPDSGFPNCCCIAYIGQPIRTDSDWSEEFYVNLNLEFMVNAATEEECNARIQRTLEAAHSVLISEDARRLPELDGKNLVSPIQGAPRVSVSELFARHPGADPNLRFFWQGGVLTYTVQKIVSY